MPELPEVETIRRFLEPRICGLTIQKIDILTPKSFFGDPKKIINKKIIKLTRLGKQLSLHLENDLALHFHLKMTGQIVYGGNFLGHPTPKQLSLPNKSTRVIFALINTSLRGVSATKQSSLYFNDQRKFGWIKVFTNAEIAETQQHLGRDILDPSFSLDYFSFQLNSSRPIKLVLLDQNRLAGIGNIYANDSLFLAGVHPSLKANQLRPPQVKKLYQAVISVISEAISHQGSTAADDKYILPDGSKGSHQYFFKVYQRVGEPCPICRTPISRITLGGRGTFFCPNCQKL